MYIIAIGDKCEHERIYAKTIRFFYDSLKMFKGKRGIKETQVTKRDNKYETEAMQETRQIKLAVDWTSFSVYITSNLESSVGFTKPVLNTVRLNEQILHR